MKDREKVGVREQEEGYKGVRNMEVLYLHGEKARGEGVGRGVDRSEGAGEEGEHGGGKGGHDDKGVCKINCHKARR